MTSEPPENSGQDKAPVSRRRGLPLGRVGAGLTVGGLALALAVGGLYLGRRDVAEEVLVGWLHRRGIAADVKVERIEWDGFTGRIIVGDPDDPDVRIDRVEVDYLIGMPWMTEGMGLTPKRVLLSKPLIKAEWTGEKLSFGTLDPLIEEFTSKPQGEKKPGPLIVVEQGRALLATPYGAIVALADARINDSRLEWLRASLDPADLTLDDMSAQGLTLNIEARSQGDSLSFIGQGRAENFLSAAASGRDAHVRFTGSLPYPREDVSKARGPARLEGELTLVELGGEIANGRELSSRLDWTGELNGWLQNFTLNGTGTLTASGRQLRVAGQDLSNVTLTTAGADVSLVRSTQGQTASPLGWQFDGPVTLQAANLVSGQNRIQQPRLSSNGLKANGLGRQMEVSGPVSLIAQGLQTGDLQLQNVRGNFALDAQRGVVTQIGLNGSLAARGRYDGLGQPGADDVPELVRIKQAARDFTLSAPSLRLVQNNRGFDLQLGAPVQLRSTNGAEVRLAPSEGPLLQMAGGPANGSAQLQMSGGGLPALDVDVRHWRMADGGLTAQLNGQGRMDFSPVKAIQLQTAGNLEIRNGLTRFTSQDCARIEASQVEFGENHLEDISGQLCPSGQPLFSAGNGQWQLAGTLRDTRLAADFLELDLDKGSGQLRVTGNPQGLGLNLTAIRAVVSDVPATDGRPLRINPLDVTGDITLARGQWRGVLDLVRGEHALGQLLLDHSNELQSGQLLIRSNPLDFREGGLQPAMISPMLANYMVNTSGDPVTLSGDVQWNTEGVQSHGLLGIGRADGQEGVGLSFDTPMGRLSGLRGALSLDDVLGFSTSVPQTLTADRLDSVIPMHNLKLTVGLGEGKVMIPEAALYIQSGEVMAHDVIVPLDGVQPVIGRVQLRELQVNDLLQAANLGDKASLDARVSGELLFSYQNRTGWSFRSVDLRAQSGYLSIQPEVLTGMSSDAGVIESGDGVQVEVPPNAVQGFAYQALENLAIDDLNAEVLTLPEGRLAINFRIHGRHAPRERKELRVSIFDLFNGNLMNRNLPLPSGTPVILNLNTNWNANELATDIYNYMQKRFDELDSIAPEGGGQD